MQQPGNFLKPSLSFVCSEDWNSMSPCEKGRFCAICQKTVVDFTKKSEAEIQELLTKQTGKEVCGRFYSHQLIQPVRSSQFPFWKGFTSLLVLLGLSFLSKEAEAQQRKKVPVKKQTQAKPKPPQVKIETGVVSIDGPLPNSDVVSYPDIRPVFKYGGEEGLQKFLKENISRTQDDAYGLVVLTFVIDTLGKVNDIQILKSLSPNTNKEAERLTKMLEFESGLLNGRKVKVNYTLPIRFRYD